MLELQLLPFLNYEGKTNRCLKLHPNPFPLWIPLGGNIPLRGNSVSILFISLERVGIFKFNFAALIQVIIETF